MKTLFTILVLACIGTSSAQEIQESPQLFAQCLFSIGSQEEMNDLQSDLNDIEFTTIVRLDWETQRAFLIIHNLEELSEEDFKSWFGEHSESVTCIQIGVHGLDPINSYPFTNCQN